MHAAHFSPINTNQQSFRTNQKFYSIKFLPSKHKEKNCKTISYIAGCKNLDGLTDNILLFSHLQWSYTMQKMALCDVVPLHIWPQATCTDISALRIQYGLYQGTVCG